MERQNSDDFSSERDYDASQGHDYFEDDPLDNFMLASHDGKYMDGLEVCMLAYGLCLFCACKRVRACMLFVFVYYTHGTL